MKFDTKDELISQSEFSPGVVDSEEQLVRVAYAPKEIVQGKLIPESISSQDLKSRGYSVFRQKHLNPNDILSLANVQMTKQPTDRKGAYTSVFDVMMVRKCRISIPDETGALVSKRSFVVIDDALEDVISHASIYSAATKNRAHVKKLKSQLIDILNQDVVLFPT